MLPGEPAGALSVTERSLENDLVRVEVADDGTLASVYGGAAFQNERVSLGCSVDGRCAIQT